MYVMPINYEHIAIPEDRVPRAAEVLFPKGACSRKFLGSPEPAPSVIMPKREDAVEVYARRMAELAAPRLEFLAALDESWWVEPVKFFDVQHERIWIFWRRVLHAAHHRTQRIPAPAATGPFIRPTVRRRTSPGAAPTPRIRWKQPDGNNSGARKEQNDGIFFQTHRDFKQRSLGIDGASE